MRRPATCRTKDPFCLADNRGDSRFEVGPTPCLAWHRPEKVFALNFIRSFGNIHC
jgi:hypothetical protein